MVLCDPLTYAFKKHYLIRCHEPTNEARFLNLSREAYYGQAVVKWSLTNSLIKIKNIGIRKIKNVERQLTTCEVATNIRQRADGSRQMRIAQPIFELKSVQRSSL